jgi:hypothetical protein
MERLIGVKERLDERMKMLNSKFNEEYYLCRDMIFENDIRVCRLEVMNKFSEKLIVVIN